jgi:hypothetical protein
MKLGGALGVFCKQEPRRRDREIAKTERSTR